MAARDPRRQGVDAVRADKATINHDRSAFTPHQL